MKNTKIILFLIVPIFIFSCKRNNQEIDRNDYAVKLNINLTGSLQNPAFSPDGKSIVFTNFKNGYNKIPADLYIFNLETEELKLLISNGSGNINLPGETWNANINAIIFSSDREPHDEIYYISANQTSGNETRITNRTDSVAYEPTLSPDGQWIVFESHKLDEEENGIITKYKFDGTSSYINLTSSENDCRQPNWSPTNEKILYQKEENGEWSIYTMDITGYGKQKITDFAGNKTDAVFSHDGKSVFFSYENDDMKFANIFKVNTSEGNPIRVTNFDGYDGAPSVSPDGKKIVFESSSGDPDKSNGTALWILNLN